MKKRTGILLGVFLVVAGCGGPIEHQPAVEQAVAVSGGRNLTLLAASAASMGADAALAQRLARLGFEVTVADPRTVSSAQLKNSAVVVISESCLSEDVIPLVGSLTRPLVVMEPAVFDELGMTGPRWAVDQGDVPSATSLTILAGQTLTEGASAGLLTVTTSPNKFVWGAPGSSAIVAARAPGTPANAAAIFGYEAGAPMVSGAAPARRVGFFAGRSTPGAFNESGWNLFDAVVRWVSRPRALFVVGDVNLSAADRILADRLSALGFAVVLKEATKVEAGNAVGTAVVVISESVTSSDVGGRLTKVPTPIVVLEPSLFDDLKLTKSQWKRDYGDTAAQTDLSILSDNGPLTGALGSGTVRVTSTPQKFVWGRSLSSSAIRAATIEI